MKSFGSVAAILLMTSGAIGCQANVIETNVDKWDVLVTNIDDIQLAVRAPKGRMHTDLSGSAIFTADIADEKRLHFILYDPPGMFGNQPYAFGIRIGVIRNQADLSGSTIDGVLESIRVELAGYDTVGNDAVVQLGERAFVKLSAPHGGSYSTTLLDGFYLSFVYTFHPEKTDPKWRQDREDVMRNMAENIRITRIN